MVADKWTVAKKLLISPLGWLEENHMYQNLEELIRGPVERGYAYMEELAGTAHEAVHSLWETSVTDFELFADERLVNQPRAFQHVLSKYDYQVSTFKGLPTVLNTKLFRLELGTLKELVLDTSGAVLRKLKQLLVSLFSSRITKLRDWIISSTRAIPKKVKSIEDYSKICAALQSISSVYEEKARQMSTLRQLSHLGVDWALDIKREDIEFLE